MTSRQKLLYVYSYESGACAQFKSKQKDIILAPLFKQNTYRLTKASQFWQGLFSSISAFSHLNWSCVFHFAQLMDDVYFRAREQRKIICIGKKNSVKIHSQQIRVNVKMICAVRSRWPDNLIACTKIDRYNIWPVEIMCFLWCS